MIDKNNIYLSPQKEISLKELTISLMMDSTSFTCKPKKGMEIASLSARLNDSTAHITLKNLSQLVGNQGYTICPSVVNNNRTLDKWLSQQVYGLDFDNKNMETIYTPQQFLEDCTKWEITPSFMYETFSSTKTLPRFRVIFVSDQIITDIRGSYMISELFIKMFPNCDRQVTRNPVSILFGGRNLLQESLESTFNPLDLLD